MEKKKKVIVIAGPTASGKTGCAVRLARGLGGEIVSADSMQIYKYMDIGSAKPAREEREQAVHYLVDEIDPFQPFSVAEYRKLAGQYIEKILESGKIPIVAGGTGLYVNSIVSDMDFSITPPDWARRKELYRLADEQGGEALHALLETLDPEAAQRIHPNNIKRMVRAVEAAEKGEKIRSFDHAACGTGEYDCLMFGLGMERQALYSRIDQRVDGMIEEGLVEEVRSLMNRGLKAENISMRGIGYKEIIACLEGEYDLEEAIRLVKRNTRRYAKRQMTWFRRYKDMIWYDLTEGSDGAVRDMMERAAAFTER